MTEETGQHSNSKEQTNEQNKDMDTDMENTTTLSQEEQAKQEENDMDFTQDLPLSEEKTIEEILMGMDLQKISKEWTPKGFEGIP